MSKRISGDVLRLPRTGLLIAFLFCMSCFAALCRADNLPDSQAIRLLGEQLFLDKSLSEDGKESCASCHKPDAAFTDGKRTAVGIHKQAGTRNTPSLLSLSTTPFFWDGRVSELTTAVLQPFTNPVEMGLRSPDILLKKIKQSHYYQVAFSQAFRCSTSSSTLPCGMPTPTIEETGQALAAYVSSLDHGSNAYDYYRSGDDTALSQEAAHGLTLFSGPAHCAECHRITGDPALFTDLAFHSTLIDSKRVAQLPGTAIGVINQGLSGGDLNAKIESDPIVSELGRFLVTHDPKDIGSFRTPSLRNVALTAPYMHDGSAATLRDAVDREIYYRSLQSNQPNTLTEQDRRDLVSFLQALTDQPRHNALNDRLDSSLLMN